MTQRIPYAAISGLGFSTISRDYIGTSRDLAIEAIVGAVEDSGLSLGALDGLMICKSPSALLSDLPLRLRMDLSLGDLTLLGELEIEGASVVGSIQQASLAIRHGMARTVACVFADAPLRPGRETGSTSYNRVMQLSGLGEWEGQYGMYGAVGPYALAAQRYLTTYGLAEDAFGHYAVACRRWASLSDRAVLREPIDMDDYRKSRSIVSPFRVLDCAYPVNGAIAIILVSAECARELAQPPVYVHGFAQGHAATRHFTGEDAELTNGAAIAAAGLWKMTGLGPNDVGMAQIYDAFSYVGLQALEDYGFCPRGQACDFVAAGETSPGGSVPVNTGGGHLSGYYLQGMTPVSEAVIQARGAGGARQSHKNKTILVTGCGGRLDYHAALLLGTEQLL